VIDEFIQKRRRSGTASRRGRRDFACRRGAAYSGGSASPVNEECPGEDVIGWRP
jgi:hypothetical protein